MSLAAPAIVRSEREITPRMRLKFSVAPGRPQGRTAGSHIDDLAALGKAIWLCPTDARKFNFIRYEYAHKRDMPFVRGACDGCGQYHPACVMFVPRTR